MEELLYLFPGWKRMMNTSIYYRKRPCQIGKMYGMLNSPRFPLLAKCIYENGLNIIPGIDRVKIFIWQE